MKLTALNAISRTKRLVELIPLIAGASWIVAGFQGIIFLTSNTSIDSNINDLSLAFLKLVPVFFATYNGVYTTLIFRKKEKYEN